MNTATIHDQVRRRGELTALLADLESFIRTFVIIPESANVLVALWVAHTHALAATDYTPYLHFTSPEPACGKSRLVDVLEHLVAQPIRTDSISRAALIRTMGSQPTLLLDELDNLLKQADLSDAVMGILCAGFCRTGTHRMCVGEGKKMRVENFPVFGPKVLSGIGTLPGPLTTRTIPIRFKRRLKEETVAKWRDREGRLAAAPLRDALQAWAVPRAIDWLKAARPTMPDGLPDRAEDVLEPLLAIAEMAGDPWATRARAAAVAILGTADVLAQSINVQLLADIRDVFNRTPTAEALFSKALREHLHAMEDRPWPTWGTSGKPITGQAIAKLLKPFGVVSAGTIRIGSATDTGYSRATFEEPWARYLPPLPPRDPPIQPSQPNNPNESGPESSILQPSHPDPVRVAKMPIASMNPGRCEGVRVQNADHGEQGPPDTPKGPPVNRDGEGAGNGFLF